MNSSKSILFVCVGNICRSPTAEYKMKLLLPDWRIESAGLAALVGHSACLTATDVASENGIDLQDHKAKQFNPEYALDFSLVLAMEACQVDAIVDTCPPLRGRTYLLGRWNNNQAIADPYKKDKEQYRVAFESIESSCEKWSEKLGIKET